MNEIALRTRIAALVVAAFLSVTGATVTATAVADDAQAAVNVGNYETATE